MTTEIQCVCVCVCQGVGVGVHVCTCMCIWKTNVCPADDSETERATTIQEVWHGLC